MSRLDFIFQRGETVRDKITGFSGVIIARSDYISGCDRYCIQPSQLENGKMIPPEWFDVHFLERDTTKPKISLYTDPDPPG